MTKVLTRPLRRAMTNIAWLVAPSEKAGACTASNGTTCWCDWWRTCNSSGCYYISKRYIYDCYANCYQYGGC
ncbi:hypothetical protein ACFFX1_07060 [Dactylosporangium sucinum]|uniref:Uncharacterized protein n=1 Tax=Dactylosporangium sucinum TaxID=1424081 RepID=A0A917X744_9ACTN|nr:hypothetical protein [Dactylosporangium sucinum]GGM84160.1 hypothetical protein GCM10007977_102040 [Dactylosporangium sucinum]